MITDTQQARALFPRGLRQPDKGFKFSVDALLLACFARLKPGERALDLGTGCGVISLGLCLRYQHIPCHIVGLDQDPDMVCSARANTRTLGWDQRMDSIRGDVREAARMLRPQWADVVVCNPPYRETGRGRICPTPSRSQARFLMTASLDDFLAAGAHVLKNRSRFYLVFAAEGLNLVFASMHAHGIQPKRIMPVYGRLGSPAKIVLVEGRKQGGQGMIMESPLVLYQCGHKRHELTPEALAFCPFLACNTGRE